MPDETQEYVVRTRFEGIDDADRYARGIWEAARAEQAATEAIRTSSRAQRQRNDSLRDAAKAQEDIKFFKGANRRLNEAREELSLARKVGAGSDVIADLETRYASLIKQVARQQAPDTGPLGPRGRLVDAQQRLNRAKAAGVGGDRLTDLEDMVKEAQRRVDRLAPKPEATASDRIAQAIMTTRFGGGIMPLVGRSAQALGIENPTASMSAALKKAVPALGTPAGEGATAAVSRFAGAMGIAAKVTVDTYRAMRQWGEAAVATAQRMADNGRAIASGRDVSGGSGAEAARLGALGMSGSDARALVDRITSDPNARGAAGRLGVSAVGGPYGTLDTAAVALKTLEALRKVKDAEEKLRLARLLGVEATLYQLRVSDMTFNAIKADAELQGRFYNARRQRDAAEFEASRKRYDDMKKMASDFASEPINQTVADVQNLAADFGNALIRKFDTQGGQDDNRRLRDTAISLVGMVIPTAGAFLRTAVGMGDTRRGQGQSQSEMVQAVQANTEALNRLNRNIGTGPRGQKALPSALQDGRNLAIAINSGNLRLGNL